MLKVLNLLPYMPEGGGLATYLNQLRSALDFMQIPHETWETANHVMGISKHMNSEVLDIVIEKIKNFNPSHIFVHWRIDPRLVAAFPHKTYFFVHDTFLMCLGYHHRLGKPCFKKFDARCLAQATLTHCGVRRPDRIFKEFHFLKNLITTLKIHNIPIVTVSQFLIDFHKNQGLTDNPYYLLRPYEKIRQPQIMVEKKYILYAGGFNAIKGFNTLIKATQLRTSTLPILIAGFSHKQNELASLIQQHGLQDTLKVIGHVDQNTLSQYYAQSYFSLMPSLLHEAFGIVGLESMAHGIPVIASQVGGISEWLQDQHNGYLIPAGDAYALANCIDRLSQNLELCQTLGSNGLKLLQSKFSQEIFIENLQKIFQTSKTS
jgi:glycosyltransferase involved in cell wall biosynthesis